MNRKERKRRFKKSRKDSYKLKFLNIVHTI